MDERRHDHEERAKLERLLEVAATKGALKALGQFTPHDLDTKEGREALRSDIDFARQGRERCSAVRGHATKALITILFTIGVVAFWDHIKAVGVALFRGVP